MVRADMAEGGDAGSAPIVEESQVFFPGPYHPKPWETVKPVDTAHSAEHARGGKRARVERSEEGMDMEFHWCFGAFKEHSKPLTDGSGLQQGWLKTGIKALPIPSEMKNGHSTWDWSEFKRNIQEKKQEAAARAAQGLQPPSASVIPWCYKTMTIKIGNYYKLANGEQFVRAIGFADEAGVFKAAVWPKGLQMDRLCTCNPEAKMMHTSSIGLHLLHNL